VVTTPQLLLRRCAVQVIGSTPVDLDGIRNNVRSRETNLGNLVADSMLQSIKQLPSFQSQYGETFIAMQNGASLHSFACKAVHHRFWYMHVSAAH
jgi:2',3'-cyclic-nucleotide 2'-phosphodiesterase (5'-nucleotidase family)